MLGKFVAAIILVSALALFVGPAAAQDITANPVLVLNDSTPSVDVVITPNNGASGVVYVELIGARVSLKDSTNTDVLSEADQRVSALAIQLAQGATPHTLHIERLPGVAIAQARVVPQGAMPVVDVSSPDPRATALNGPSAASVVLAPAQTLPVTVTDKADMLSVQFPGKQSTMQIVDDKAQVVLTSTVGKEISGLAVKLAPGQYAVNLANTDLKDTADVTLSLSTGPVATLPDKTVADQPSVQQGQTAVNTAAACTATVNVASVNLRSGPGTAYSTLGSSGQATKLAVGGVNSEGGWLLVRGPNGSAWVSAGSTTLSGNCNSLAVFNIPLRNASQQVVVAQQQPAVNGGQPQGDDHHEDSQQNQQEHQDQENGGEHD